MVRFGSRVLIAVVLVGLGWVGGRAQGRRPDFELVVRAPNGQTQVECVRGCYLAWVERVVPESLTPQSTTFSYGCSGATCDSGRIGGWLRPAN